MEKPLLSSRFFAPKTKNGAISQEPRKGQVGKSEKKPSDATTPEAKKRPLETSCASQTSPVDGAKKACTAQSPMSSPEAKKKAMDNRRCAKIKLRSKELDGALHPTIGPSWFEALQAEFDKPYFAQLNQFLQSERASQIIYPPADQVGFQNTIWFTALFHYFSSWPGVELDTRL